MKTKLLLFSAVTALLGTTLQAQNRTSVNATSSEISDNLDLRAIASIFGDARDLDDFERRLNDPRAQISNLDLNYDNQVDYLRVVESVERNTHLIVVQAVLDRDVYQDVATIDVERDRNNNVQVQVIGDVFMYGNNYIYEPVYYTTPAIYASFWRPSYRAYTSRWNWGFYPSYFVAWNPFPVFRYRNNINICLNNHNRYNYVNSRRSNRAVVLYNARRNNGFERLHPNDAFSRRNTSVSNRYELEQRRTSSRVASSAARRTASGNNDFATTSRGSGTVQGTTTNRNQYKGTARAVQTNNSNRAAAKSNNNNNNNNNNSYSSRTNNETGSPVDSYESNYSQNRRATANSQRSQRNEYPNATASNRSSAENGTPARRESAPRNYSQNRSSSATQAAPQRQESSSRGNSNRESESRTNSNQRTTSERSDNRRS